MSVHSTECLSVQRSRAQISLDYADGLCISRITQCVFQCVEYSVAGFPTATGLVCSVESTRALISLDSTDGFSISRSIQIVFPCVEYIVSVFPRVTGLVCAPGSVRPRNNDGHPGVIVLTARRATTSNLKNM